MKKEYTLTQIEFGMLENGTVSDTEVINEETLAFKDNIIP
jgi:hypothetical protein